MGNFWILQRNATHERKLIESDLSSGICELLNASIACVNRPVAQQWHVLENIYVIAMHTIELITLLVVKLFPLLALRLRSSCILVDNPR